MEQHVFYKIILIVFKCVNEIAPKELIEKIVRYKDRDKLTLSHVQFKSKSGRRSFTYIAPRLWNEVPYKIKTLTDVEKFKTQLKTLMYSDFDEFKARVFKYIE